ncbi:MAG: disulfide bond formation protein DsbA, partial [Actinobacteria bacterium HGW-Actinobacteria-9]
MLRVAARDGFAFVSPNFVPNTHRALVLGEFARDAGEEIHRAVHAAIFDAYFAQGRDIGQADVLLE